MQRHSFIGTMRCYLPDAWPWQYISSVASGFRSFNPCFLPQPKISPRFPGLFLFSGIAMESYSTYSLPELIDLVADGDELAFTIIVNRLWKNCYFHALTYTHSPQKAEEITQDILMQVWKNRAKLKEIVDFEHWFKVVARNKIISALRGKLHEIAGLDTVQETTTIESLLVPDLQAEYRESYQILLKGIELMPEKRREVFKLSRLEGKSNQEIAKQLNIHPVTVSQYLAKSLAFLKTYLQEQEVSIGYCLLLVGGFIGY